MTTYRGKVQNGMIVLEGGIHLPEGTAVDVARVEPARDPFDTLGDEAADTGVTDMATEHDHYIYGTPKRSQSEGR